jgi:hypothetical protein
MFSKRKRKGRAIAQAVFFNSWGGTLGTAATADLLYQPRMIGDGDCGEKLVEWILAEETEVLGKKNCPWAQAVSRCLPTAAALV